MEIDLIVEECTKQGDGFINFSIRRCFVSEHSKYVTETRNKDPTKCRPFGSLGDPHDHKIFLPYQSSESTSLSANSPEVDILSQQLTATGMIDNKVGKDIYDDESSGLTNGQCRHKNSVDEDSKIGSSDNIGLLSTRKRRRFRLLSDIYKDPASEMGAHCDITKPVNVNHKFFSETEDDTDNDATLFELYRKQKGVQLTDPTVKKKSQMVRVEEPNRKKSKRKFRDMSVSDLEVGPLRKKTIIDDTESKTMEKGNMVKTSSVTVVPKNEKKVNRREATESPYEDFEMEAVMLLAYHFKKENSTANNGQVLHELETKHSSPSVKKSITKTSSTDKQKTLIKEKLEDVFRSVQMKDHIETCMMKAAEVARDAQNCSVLLCSVNQNPADFSIPNAKNKFMRS